MSEENLIKLVPGTRILRDSISENVYFVLGNSAFYDHKLRKIVKCGLGHKMWVSEMDFIICEHRKCNARIKLERVENPKLYGV